MIARVTRQTHVFCRDHNRNEIRGGTGQERPWGGVPGTVAWERQNDKSKDLSTIRWEGGTGQEASLRGPTGHSKESRLYHKEMGTIQGDHQQPLRGKSLAQSSCYGHWVLNCYRKPCSYHLH